MRASGYYWIVCQDKECCPTPEPQIAYFDSEDPERPWMLIYSEVKQEGTTFHVLGKVPDAPVEVDEDEHQCGMHCNFGRECGYDHE